MIKSKGQILAFLPTAKRATLQADNPGMENSAPDQGWGSFCHPLPSAIPSYSEPLIQLHYVFVD